MNNKNFFFILCSLVLICCGQQKQTDKEIVTSYFNARDSGDFKIIKALIDDSLTITEGDYIMPYTFDSYYEVFKWDSVFQTSYDIISLEKLDEHIIASVQLSSIKNEFLENKLMICRYKVSINSGKISHIESLDCSGADWDKWQQKVTRLVAWIETNHPELNGFIYDMTEQGAVNYLSAIELYKTQESD